MCGRKRNDWRPPGAQVFGIGLHKNNDEYISKKKY